VLTRYLFFGAHFRVQVDRWSIVPIAVSTARSCLGFGGLEHGASADIVGYDEDPRAHPGVLRHPTRIILRGQVVLFSLDVDDTLFRGQSWCSADGIAAPTICVGEARSILKSVAAAVEIFRQPDYRRDRARLSCADRWGGGWEG
jgi:hypothetical protein